MSQQRYMGWHGPFGVAAGAMVMALTLPVAKTGAEILVSSFFDDAVVVLDETTGDLLGTFTNGGGLTDPEGLLLGANGNLLVVSRDSGRVLEYDRWSGDFVRVLIDDQELASPHGMISDDDGDILICAVGGVRKYDGVSGAPLGVFAAIEGSLVDLAYGPNGNLFVSTFESHSVVEVDRETGQVLGMFASGEELVDPTLILFGGPGDDLFVGSRRTPASILQYDGHSGDFVRIFASDENEDDIGPVLVHPNGNLIASNGFGNTLLEFDFKTGDLVRTFANEGLNFATFALVLQLCPADLDGSGDVGFGDLLILLAAWGPCEGDCPADLDDDDVVRFGDLLILLAAWGPCEQG